MLLDLYLIRAKIIANLHKPTQIYVEHYTIPFKIQSYYSQYKCLHFI